VAIRAALDADGLHVRFTGWSRILACAGRLEVPAAHIVAVERTDWPGLRRRLLTRVAGSGVPGGLHCGWFLLRPARQGLALLWITRDGHRDIVTVTTGLSRPVIVALSATVLDGAAKFRSAPASGS
jgi:hypothetical protein